MIRFWLSPMVNDRRGFFVFGTEQKTLCGFGHRVYCVTIFEKGRLSYGI